MQRPTMSQWELPSTALSVQLTRRNDSRWQQQQPRGRYKSRGQNRGNRGRWTETRRSDMRQTSKYEPMANAVVAHTEEDDWAPIIDATGGATQRAAEVNTDDFYNYYIDSSCRPTFTAR